MPQVFTGARIRVSTPLPKPFSRTIAPPCLSRRVADSKFGSVPPWTTTRSNRAEEQAKHAEGPGAVEQFLSGVWTDNEDVFLSSPGCGR